MLRCKGCYLPGHNVVRTGVPLPLVVLNLVSIVKFVSCCYLVGREILVILLRLFMKAAATTNKATNKESGNDSPANCALFFLEVLLVLLELFALFFLLFASF